MKRRMGIASLTGLGGGGKSLMNGQAPSDKELLQKVNECAEDAYKTFFKGTKIDEEYCDAGFEGNEIRFGIEPSYQFEKLKMISISQNKSDSFIVTGIAFGAWGTGIRSKTKEYSQYSKKGKFVRFVDKWHSILFDNNLNK